MKRFTFTLILLMIAVSTSFAQIETADHREQELHGIRCRTKFKFNDRVHRG